MKEPGDVPVHRLVVDSGAFIKHAKLQDLASEIYTTSGVINELKCDKSRHLLDAAPYEIIIREPTAESLQKMKEISKKTGDFPSLSLVDLKVLALAHDLHIDAHGSDSLDYECKQRLVLDNSTSSAEEVSNSCEGNADNCVAENDNASDCEATNSATDSDCSGEDDSEDGVWINEKNLHQELKHLAGTCLPQKNTKVACTTTDFAMQNVLLRLGMNLISVDGFQIKSLRSYILRCRACFATTAVMTKKFCARCGNDALHRVAITVNEDGTTQLHINWQRLESTRGLRYSLPAPKGGKHDNAPQLFEDQRIPHNRPAKCHVDGLQTGPFSLNDVSSRSAMLGIKSLHKDSRARNTNLRTRGKKRGNKKR